MRSSILFLITITTNRKPTFREMILYIEKETDVNDEIDRLRLAATAALMSRRDVIIVASVSCIYGLGNPEAYGKGLIHIDVGSIYRRNALLRQLVESQYQRNDLELRPGVFRVRGDILEIFPAYEERKAYRVSMFGDEVEKIISLNPLTGEVLETLACRGHLPGKTLYHHGATVKAGLWRILKPSWMNA